MVYVNLTSLLHVDPLCVGRLHSIPFSSLTSSPPCMQVNGAAESLAVAVQSAAAAVGAAQAAREAANNMGEESPDTRHTTRHTAVEVCGATARGMGEGGARAREIRLVGEVVAWADVDACSLCAGKVCLEGGGEFVVGRGVSWRWSCEEVWW